MLGYLIWGFLIYAGWRRFPWWTPVATCAVAVPVMVFQFSSVNSWRGDAGLLTYSADQIAFAILANLAIWSGFYWIGRGVARMVTRSGRTAATPSPAFDGDLASGEHELRSRQLPSETLIGQSRQETRTFPFKDNAAAFAYACKFLECELAKSAMLPAIVQDGRALFGTKESVQVNADGTQDAVLRVASRDGGFLVVAKTTGRGPPLKPGDFVGWIAGQHSANLAEASPDKRFGWVGLIVGTLCPEWRDGSWVGQDRYRAS